MPEEKDQDECFWYPGVKVSAESIRHSSLSFDIPFDRQQLADYLCINRAAMSTEISKLQKEGFIKTNRNHFELIACNETDLQDNKWWYNSIVELIERVDMRKAIVYASVHHGNTEKIVNSIAETCRVDIENRTTIYKKENEKNHFYLL